MELGWTYDELKRAPEWFVHRCLDVKEAERKHRPNPLAGLA